MLSLCPKPRFFARSGPPFVIQSDLIELGCPRLQMVDLSERENGVWRTERGDRANTEYYPHYDPLSGIMISNFWETFQTI